MATKTTNKEAGSKSAVDILTDNHQKILRLFTEFEELKDDTEQMDEKQMLVENTCAELAIHAQLEEEIFYPAMRDAIDDQNLLDEAEVEHNMADQLITELESMQPGDELYDAKFSVLGEYVKHHIEKEQNRLFAIARQAGLDLESLGDEIMERKQELLDEYGLDQEENIPPASGKHDQKHRGGAPLH